MELKGLRNMDFRKCFSKLNILGLVTPFLISAVFGLLVYIQILSETWRTGSRIESVGVVLLLTLVFHWICSVVANSGSAQIISDPGPFRELVEKYSLLFISLLIVLPVIIFNLVHVFGPRYLLADDPSRYLAGIDSMVRMWLWMEHFVLNAFSETFAWWVAAHYSPFVVRLLYLLVYLSGISLAFYWISRRIFSLSPEASFLAAVLPAVFPLQFQIIAGINMSYTLPGQLMVLLGIIAGFCCLTRRDHSWLLLILAGVLFTAATRQMEQAVFISAAVVFLYLAISGSFLRKIGLILPVILSSSAVLYRMLTMPRGAAEIQEISLDEIIYRCKTFTLYLSPYLSPVHREYAIPVVLVLIMAGTVSFFLWPELRKRVAGQPHFSWLPECLRLCILPGFVFLWTVPSILPFISMNKHMDARTMHLSGYGPWLLMAPGLLFVLSSVLSFADRRLRKKAIIFICALIVIISGLQHMQYAAKAYEKGNYYWEAVSRAITFHAFPEGSQIVITDADTGTHNSYPPCTGYLARMLGNRTDIGGVVGPEYFFYDPFSQVDLWKNPMTGLKGEGSLHLFRFVPGKESEFGLLSGTLERFGYFLRVASGGSENGDDTRAGDWSLFKLGDDGKARSIFNGHGMEEYRELLLSLKAEGITPDQICWGNPADDFGCNSPRWD